MWPLDPLFKGFLPPISSRCIIDLLGVLVWIQTRTSFCLTKKLAVSLVFDEMKSNSDLIEFFKLKLL